MTQRLKTLESMHAADPKDADLPYMIALEFSKDDDPATAIDWLDKTLALDQDYLYAYFQKAKMLGDLGEDSQGQAVLNLGIERANQVGDAKASSEMTELRAALADDE